jgi:hypothetical protein
MQTNGKEKKSIENDVGVFCYSKICVWYDFKKIQGILGETARVLERYRIYIQNIIQPRAWIVYIFSLLQYKL